MFLIIRGASYLIVHIFFKIFRRVWCVIMISNWNCMFMRLQKFFFEEEKTNQKNDNFVMVLGDFYFGVPEMKQMF